MVARNDLIVLNQGRDFTFGNASQRGWGITRSKGDDPLLREAW